MGQVVTVSSKIFFIGIFLFSMLAFLSACDSAPNSQRSGSELKQNPIFEGVSTGTSIDGSHLALQSISADIDGEDVRDSIRLTNYTSESLLTCTAGFDYLERADALVEFIEDGEDLFFNLEESFIYDLNYHFNIRVNKLSLLVEGQQISLGYLRKLIQDLEKESGFVSPVKTSNVLDIGGGRTSNRSIDCEVSVEYLTGRGENLSRQFDLILTTQSSSGTNTSAAGSSVLD